MACSDTAGAGPGEEPHSSRVTWSSSVLSDRWSQREAEVPLYSLRGTWAGPEDASVQRAVLLTTCAREKIATCRESLATEQQRNAFKAVETSAPLVNILLVIYMAAYLFEVPAWCWMEEDSCGDPNVVPRSPISSTLSLQTCRLLQMVCLGCFIWHTLAQKYAMGMWRYRQYFSASVELFAILDVFVATFNHYGLPPKRVYWSPLLRPFVFLGQNLSVRRFMSNALPAMTNRTILDLVLLQGLFLLVWAWFGLLLFGGSEEGSKYFSGYGEALLSLFTLFTTANFPDIMMIAYKENRWVFAYFCTYLVMSLYVLFNVLLAALFNSYKARVQGTHEALKARSSETLNLAFDILVAGGDREPGGSEQEGDGEPEDGLPMGTWKRFCAQLSAHLGVHWDEQSLEAVFTTLAGESEESRFSRDAWELVAPELAKRSQLVLEAHVGGADEGLVSALGLMHWVVDASVVLSLVVTLVHTHDFLEKERPVWECAWWLQALHFAVCLAYFVEAGLRLAVLGCGQLRCYRWLVDSLLAVACVTLEGLLYACGPSSAVWRGGYHHDCNRALALLRAARVERVLWRFSGPRATLQMLLGLVSTFRTAGAAMFFVFYLYSTVGVQVFGGLIRTDAPSLQKTEFAGAGHVGYWANNFNDFASGCVVLFELMVVNNWYVVAGGLAAAGPGASCVGWLFCISFYFCIHIVILNVLVTSVVESYERIRTVQGRPAVCLENLALAVSRRSAVAGAVRGSEDSAGSDSLLLQPVRCLSGNATMASMESMDEGMLLHDRRASMINSNKEKLKELVIKKSVFS